MYDEAEVATIFWHTHTKKKSNNPLHSTGSIDVDCVHLLQGFVTEHVHFIL